METDLAGTRLSLYRVAYPDKPEQLRVTTIDVVKETPTTWIVKPCRETGYTTRIDKELGFLHRTKGEAIDAFQTECTNNLRASEDCVRRYSALLAMVDKLK